MEIIKIESPKIYKALDWVNKNVSSDTQRLIMGVTAICTQPLIDLSNKNVDDETRCTSAMKTISKIIVGTTVGVLVRHYSIKLARNWKYLWHQKGDLHIVPAFPDKNIRKETANEYFKNMNDYANTVGTIIGTGVGLITNFVIDAPCTKAMTNYLNEHLKPHFLKNVPKEQEAKDERA